MKTIQWGAVTRGNLKALADHERQHDPVIPKGSSILVWEKVSWWRRSKPPRTETWGGGFDVNRAASFCWEAGSEAERAFARWQQPGARTY